MSQVNAEANALLASAPAPVLRQEDAGASRGDGSEDKDRTGDISIDNVRAPFCDTSQNGNPARLVPVAESIRYRKRAQAAEQKVEKLSEQLNAVLSEAQELADKFSQLETEQVLTRKLVAAGASDLETALLVARARAAEDGADVDGLVEQLGREKPHLFDSAKIGNTVPWGTRTAPAKDRPASGKSSLAKAAAKAASTGSRVDLHEYLRLRRNFV